jgi:F0F1-type ATP synthase membrane subunit b/b'
MSFAELEKIIADGKNKFKAFETADVALSQVKALAQHEAEVRKSLDEGLTLRAAFKKELDGVKDKIEAAQVKAADIVGEANAKAETAIENALKNINDMQDKASAKLLETNDRVTVAERKAIIAEGLAKEAEAKLAELSAAVDKQKAALRKMIGE